MSYIQPQDGLFVFNTKKDFEEFYYGHKKVIDEGIHDESLEVKFTCPNGKVKILGIPEVDDLDQLLDDLPEGIKTDLIQNVRVFN